MQLRYRVHGANTVRIETEVELKDGGTARALLPVLDVELVPDGQVDGAGTIKLRLPAPKTEADTAWVQQFLTADRLFDLALTPVEPATP